MPEPSGPGSGRLPGHVADRLPGMAFAAGWRVVRVLPDRAAYALFDVVADVIWCCRGAGVRRLEANLARAVPTAGPAQLRALGRAGMRSYLRYWCDAFRLPDWSRERILATFRLVDGEAMRAVLASGRGVVMALAHQGNWDHAGAWSALDLARVTTVAERLRPERLYRRFLAYRQRLGMEILPLTGDPDLAGILVRRLRDGGFVPLLADRDLTAQGVPVRLLGEPARMAAGPALLALRTGAALYPLTIHYERLPRGAPARWGTVATVHPEVPVPSGGTTAARVAEMTQACADALGTGIAAHPQDWHMLQRVFTADAVAGAVAAEAG